MSRRVANRLDQLLAALATTPIDREEVYRLFGACRFGFHEALAVWRDNVDARDGLARAIVAVAEPELAADHPEAAVTMLGATRHFRCSSVHAPQRRRVPSDEAGDVSSAGGIGSGAAEPKRARYCATCMRWNRTR